MLYNASCRRLFSDVNRMSLCFHAFEVHPIEGHFDQLQNLLFFFKQVFVTTHVREDLVKKRDGKFGVQQLPLFNILKPEDVDWLVGLL